MGYIMQEHSEQPRGELTPDCAMATRTEKEYSIPVVELGDISFV